MHGDKPFGFQFLEDLDGIIGSHVSMAKCLRVIGTDGKQGNFWGQDSTDLLKTVEIGAVASVIYTASLVLKDKASIAAVMIVQHAGTPVFTGGQRDRPVAVLKALPPFEFNNSAESKAVCQVGHSPGHDANPRLGEFAQGGFMEVIKVGMREEDQVDRRQVPDVQPGAFDPFEQEEPIGEVGVHQDV